MNQELKNLQFKYAINLFDWYDFANKNTKKESDSKVLVIGDVFENFIYSMSKRVGKLSIALMTNDIYDILKYNSFLENVEINTDLLNSNVDSFIDHFKNEKFDYIIIMSLTDKIETAFGKNLYDIIKNVKVFGSDNVKFLFTFDNIDSFNVIAGNKLEDDVLAFNYKNINDAVETLKRDFEKINVDIYFPLPEYKFPMRIYSEEYLPFLDDEREFVKNLVRLNKFKEYCNSFILVVDYNYNEDDAYKTLYVKYNLNRTKKFALRTSILRDNKGEKIVVKKAVYSDANQHVDDMVRNVDAIKNKFIEMIKPIKYVKGEEASDGKAYAVYPFIEGSMLTDVIIDKIRDGYKEKDIITEYMFKLIGKINGLIQNYNLDCTFQNAIINNEKIYIIDSEWVSTDTTEVDFLRYRILKYFHKSSKQFLSYATFRDMIRDFNISYNDIERYENAENEFQSKVHENINNLDVTRYEDLNPSLERLYYVKAELDRTKDQLERITGGNNMVDYQANKQNEIIRLTNVHVNNLENIIKNLKEQIGALTEQNGILFKREGISYKIVRKLKRVALKILPKETIRSKICKYIYRTIRHPFKMLKTYFTRDGRNRIVGDFLIGDVYFECGKISFSKVDKPLVSIIVPCYNQIAYTYKCLYSIFKNTDFEKTSYEVIIADDVSTDATKNIEKFIENIVVSRNKENIGFLRNCNNAVKLAKGEYIYFLNNDTEVKENTISSLVSILERDSVVGMVGSKLIYANGTLQEAGGIIYDDGTGANYGRGDDPKDFKYNYVKEVDYISGASIMIRASLFNVIGGFDERYVPAYCEDSDLAFEVRKYGYKVVYQPLSEVIHYEGVSCGTDTTDTNSIKSYQVVNQEKLKEKWANEFENQYKNANGKFLFDARERGMNKKTILFIDHYVPTWDKDAGSKTVFSYMLMFLCKGYRVKFLGDNFLLNEPYGNVLQQLGIEVLYGNTLQSSIWDYLKENKKSFDFIFLNRPHIATKYIDFIRQNMFTKIVYYGHDLHYLRLEREYNLMGDDKTLSEFKYYRNLEYSLLYKSDISYYPSYKEIEEIKRVDETLRVKCINAYIFDKKEIINRDFNNTKDILFVGGFAHDPNKDAIKWFHESIMPRIKSRNKNINLIVVGSNPTDEIVNLCKDAGYNLLGYVSDNELLNLYKTTRIVIAPLRYGAGIKGKIVEAMANGAAIITTSCGAEGIMDAEEFMEITDDAPTFSQKILKLYDDFETLKKLSIRSQEVINKKFTMDAAWDIIKDDF